ncbi:MAG: hypothetical protein IT204_21765 [Fimbriimonadaceae bacterium]|nr:hypothetical protein [Fimbriimonadaceae bacterium]
MPVGQIGMRLQTLPPLLGRPCHGGYDVARGAVEMGQQAGRGCANEAMVVYRRYGGPE